MSDKIESNGIVRILTILSKFFVGVSMYVAYPLIVVIVTGDVFMRWVFNSPFGFSVEACSLLLILGIYLCCCEVERCDKQIRLDILYIKMSPRAKFYVNMLSRALAMVWLGILTSRSIMEVPVSIKTWEAGQISGIPFWPVRAAMSLSFLLLEVWLFVQFTIGLGKIFKGAAHD